MLAATLGLGLPDHCTHLHAVVVARDRDRAQAQGRFAQ
jgi:hypothetical protein